MDLTYSTLAVDQGQRFSYWHDVVCKHCIPASSIPLSNGAFDGKLTVRSVGPLAISEMCAPAHAWERDAHHLRTGPDEDFWLSYMIEGEGHLSQLGREVVQRPGDMVLYDAARPFKFSLSAGSMYVLKVPRNLLHFRFPMADTLTAVRLGEGLSLGRLMGGMVSEAATMNLPADRPGTATLFASALLDMLAATMELQAAQPGRQSSHQALVRRAKDYMEKHLDDADIDVAQLAAAQAVSPRTLTRAFAEQDTTPMHWLWQRRIEASYCALREGHARNVTEAALRFGFSDLSHFSRAFKKVYGVSPQALMRQRN